MAECVFVSFVNVVLDTEGIVCAQKFTILLLVMLKAEQRCVMGIGMCLYA